MAPEKRFTRSSIPLSERNKMQEELIAAKRKKEALLNAPFVDYKGKLNYYTTFPDCAEACEKLLQEATECEDCFILGFDLEWPFSFTTGPGLVATMQISPSLDVCHILQISALKKLPKSVTELITHPKVRLTGVNIKNDIRKLARDFPGFDENKAIENCIELRAMAKEARPNIYSTWSMEKLVMHFYELRINKDNKIRMSKWNIFPLSEKQLKYAAIDAYMSLKLYLLLKTIEPESENID